MVLIPCMESLNILVGGGDTYEGADHHNEILIAVVSAFHSV